MNAASPGFLRPAGLFVGGRLLNMAVGLLMIPLLIHSLGGIMFAAWAILLSCSVVFSELQLGIPIALTRAMAVTGRADRVAILTLWSSAMAFLLAIHLALLPLVVVAAPALADWLRLPLVGPWHPGMAILAIFVCVALRSVLLTGNWGLMAHLRFRYAAALSLAQPFLSNTAATVVAWLTHDLAATLLAFWVAQLAVVGGGFAVAQHLLGGMPRLRLVDRGRVRRLFAYGAKVQIGEWAQTINFQFDKFVIVRVLGLWPAALYEVSNRSVLALRSIPASGMETFLPIAAQEVHDAAANVESIRRMTLLALGGVLIFFAAPLAVAPVFLYAWVGEMGYVSRYVFVSLAVGAGVNLLALPIATIAQAAGHPQVQARASMVSMLVNVPLSLLLVHVSGVEGAALGSSIAMILGTIVLVHGAARAVSHDVVAVAGRAVARHWALIAVCLGWGLAVHLAFGRWFTSVIIYERYTVGLRARAGLVALGLYCGCLLALLAVKVWLIGLSDSERDLLRQLRAITTHSPPL